ncbi:MAG: ABC transporter ATP-binding protein [Coriobacteriia bacterium]|nr:ABC transporter ATP-binding protein [Coriobacteriia bacterium]
MEKLTNANINDTVNKVKAFYTKEGADSSQIIATNLLIEDVLCSYQINFGKETQYKYSIKKNKNKAYLTLKVKSPQKNPFNKEEMRNNEDALVYERLFANLRILPTYTYSHDFNVIVFKISLKGTNFRETFKFCWRFIDNYKVKFVLAISLQALTAIFDVVVPLLTATIIVAYTDKVLDQILITALSICLVRIIVALLNWIIVNIYNRVFFTAKINLIVYVCEVTTQVRNYCLDKKGAGLFVRRLTEDVDTLSQGTQGISETIIQIANFIGILGAVCILSPLSFAYIFITLFIGAMVERKRTKIYKKDDRVYRESTEIYSNFIVELVNGIKDIKLFNGRKNFVNETRKKVTDTRSKGLLMYDKNFRFRFFREGLTGIFDFGFMVILGVALCTNFLGTTVADALVLFNYNASLGPNTFLTITRLFDSIKNFNLSGERIMNLIDDEEYPKDKFGKTHLDKIEGKITFKNVNFAYNHSDPREVDINVLQDVNLDIEPGESVGFVGKTGSGKTTILNLIGKIYDVYNGELLLDDVNINDLDEDTIRNNTITITQNPYIFNMSIKDNLRIVRADATEQEIEKVCKLACIHDDIKKLRNSYDTLVGENGINLSGGQRQRLAIARALLINASIIMFDESTSALDNVTQSKVIENIKNHSKGSTVIMVAHRLSTIRDAQKIVFVDEGKIVAVGKHKDLFENCKKYRELYDLEDSIT